jgi:hypothetical protein
MFEKPSPPSRGLRAASAAAFGTVLAVLGGIALAAQDKYTVRVPNGLAFSEFRGYEKWQMVAASHTDNLVEVILANPVMIDAYVAGFPGNGKKVTDGAKMVKIHWNKTKNAEGFPIMVPDTLHDVDLMAKDSKRFADSGGWGYGQFNYDTASESFTPLGTGAQCGYACHTAAAAKDYVFTGYPKR